MRWVTQLGLDLITRFEGLRLQAYQDVRGVWTIGYGHTKGVQPGQVITKEQAEQFLHEDLSEAESLVDNEVRVRLNDDQFSALVSLVFNIGAEHFLDSTLLHKLNAGDYAGAAAEFPRWCHVGAETSRALLGRREAERAVFEGKA